MQKLMAFDIDGTLLFEDGIEPRTVQAIRAWREAGHIAACSSGKSIFATEKAFEPYGIEFDYYVMFTGAVVTDSSFKALHQSTLQPGLVQRVFDEVSTYEGVNLYATTLEQDYELYNGTGTSSHILPAFSPLDPAQIGRQEFIGAPIWSPNPEVLEQLLGWLNQNFAGSCDIHINQTFIDIVPPNSTKGSGLEFLVKHLRESGVVTGELETFSVGDSWNDLSMHAWAGTSASFPYSPAEVRAVTTEVVEKTYDFIDRHI